MKTKYRVIHFLPNENGSWSCINNKTNSRLLLIDYYKPWRQFCVIDVEENTIFNVDCLCNIADFLEQLNNEKPTRHQASQ